MHSNKVNKISSLKIHNKRQPCRHKCCVTRKLGVSSDRQVVIGTVTINLLRGRWYKFKPPGNQVLCSSIATDNKDIQDSKEIKNISHHRLPMPV